MSAAAKAKRMHTRPEASLSKPLSRMCIIRRDSQHDVIADTAIGSVGERMAASANATASGTAGISQWMKKPTPTTVKSTRPSASSRMMAASLNRPRFGMRQPSRNSSGGMNSRKKMSGLERNADVHDGGEQGPERDLHEGTRDAKRQHQRDRLAQHDSDQHHQHDRDLSH